MHPHLDVVLAVLGGIVFCDIARAFTRSLGSHLHARSFRKHVERELKKHPARLISLDTGPKIEPREVDPERPPRMVIHVQAPGDPVTLCTCHHEPIADGDRVLLWPGVELFCQRTYSEDEMGGPTT